MKSLGTHASVWGNLAGAVFAALGGLDWAGIISNPKAGLPVAAIFVANAALHQFTGQQPAQ